MSWIEGKVEEKKQDHDDWHNFTYLLKWGCIGLLVRLIVVEGLDDEIIVKFLQRLLKDIVIWKNNAQISIL